MRERKERETREEEEERGKEEKQKQKKGQTHVSLLVGAVASLCDDAAALVDEHAADGDLLALEGGGGLRREEVDGLE